MLAHRQLGLAFAIRSAISIATLAGVLALVPYPDVTPDPLLTALFGGVFIGAGIGLAMRGGAVLDGTEIAALLISKRWFGVKVGDVILGFNIVLFVVAMSILGTEEALYSIVTYAAAAKTLEFVLHGIEEYTATYDDDDKDFVGTIDGTTGLFTPNLDGPNPKRKNNANNYGDVWVVASYQQPGTPAAKALKARAHLLVTVPLYIKWDQPEVGR